MPAHTRTTKLLGTVPTTKAFNTIQTDAQYASSKRYVEAIQDRESFRTVCKPVRCHVWYVRVQSELHRISERVRWVDLEEI